ncbi:MAG: molybdopterin oxidoreductase [Pseudomonadota bacterium]|nr:molybdopterin oxidoreductase [Pseudomonadota bacterium]
MVASSHVDMNVKPGNLLVSARFKTTYSVLMFLGLAVFLVGLKQSQERAWASYLIGFFFFTSLSLGGIFFTCLQHVTHAGWSVNIRRFSESMSAFLPYAFVLGLIFLFTGSGKLYDWLDSSYMMADPLLAKKASYLNGPFFAIRILLFFLIWLVLKNRIIGQSLKQDENNDSSITNKVVPWSIAFLLIFALSYTLFSIDTIMSLDPHWYSTMFGVYCFAGLFQASLAMMILITIWIRKKGLVNAFVKTDHLHDLGKFLKGFTVFMAYIGFSQFMLIWYANLPEETEFFLHRSHSGWMNISLSLLIFKFIVPFLLLLPMKNKRSTPHLTLVSILVLIMEYVDLYWLIYPNIKGGSHVMFGVWEIGVFLGFLGAFMFAVSRFLAKHSLIPMNDPRRHESMAHHVSY